MKKILVTGAQGQLGKCIRKIAEKYTEFQFIFKSIDKLDITDIEQLSACFKNENFDYCINAAAYTDVEQAEKTPEKAFLVNAGGVKNIALAAKRYGVTLVHISTDYVFDGNKESAYLTTDIPNPINEYGKSKLAGERHIKENMNAYFIIRTSWLYSEFGHNFYNTILSKAKRGESLFVTDTEVGCPTNANHLAKYILDILENNGKDFGVHHFTDGIPMSWFQFAASILTENGLDGQIQLSRDTKYRTLAQRPRNSILKSEDF